MLGALAVGLGAFGAHGLAAIVDNDTARIGWWETATLYHLVHAVMIAVTALLHGRAARVAGVLFILGIVLFSGTLYGMSLGAPRILGAITPLGGLSFIVGWLALLLTIAPQVRPTTHG